VEVREEIGAIFENGRDLTVGLEEEFQILDADTLSLTNRYQELKEHADKVFGGPLVSGELIQSEAEINSVAGKTFAESREDLRSKRAALTRAAADLGLALGSTGVHPFSHWRDQRFIDSEHYRRVIDELEYVAWTNNTFGLHVHVGIRGADRAVAVHDAYRSYVPELLALSASSPFYHGGETKLHSTRAQVFVEAFPRCGDPDPYGDWATYADYADFLFGTNSITESTMIWWTLRLHHLFGTLEVRAMDAQPVFEDSMAMAGLSLGLVAALLERYDRGENLAVHPRRFIEENRWRARRYGLDGKLIDLETRTEIGAVEALKRRLGQVEPLAEELGLEAELARVEYMLVEGNSAQRQLARFRGGEEIFEIFSDMVRLTMTSHQAEAAAASEA